MNPGQRLCLAEDKYIGGNGTYCRQGYIISCLTGIVKIVQHPDKVKMSVLIILSYPLISFSFYFTSLY